jgi:hypothetical protein
MRIYAERPGRAALQVLADVAVLVWVVVIVEAARTARALLLALQAPAARLTGAGESLRGAFDNAAATASGVPFVGDDLARALSTGTGAGDSLSSSGRELAAAVASAGTGALVAILLIGVVPVVALWITLRVRWVLAAGSARTARDADPGLLALQALTRRPARRLLAVTPDPGGAWRRGDPETVAGLAAVELAALGLRAPAELASPGGPGTTHPHRHMSP